MLPTEWQFDTTRVGRRVLVYDEVDSTNSVAAALAKPEFEGLVVIARNQTAGRGRFGRTWQSRPGSSILMSVVLFPPPALRRASILTAWAAVAVGEAVEELTGIQPQIKWPNDLLIDGKKVCGILIEQGAAVIVGIGLNLNQTAEEFALADLPTATSIATVAGSPIEMATASESLVRHLDAVYSRLLVDIREVEKTWKWRTGLLGHQVVVELGDGGSITGRLKDIGFEALEVITDDGEQIIIPETVAHVSSVQKYRVVE